MKHYHGSPVGGSRQDVARFLVGRHALVPFLRQDDLGVVADVCQSFIFDNSAFSVWKRGAILDVSSYKAWVRDWCLHPGFDWALIPDVIGEQADEKDNDAHISDWEDSGLAVYGVPVWHLHESIDRLLRLCDSWTTVALGSSGQWRTPGSRTWWGRMREVMTTLCDKDGKPPVKLHGLRMMNPAIFTKLPLASADSTNAGMNGGSLKRFGVYVPPTASQRAAVIADRIESHNSAPIWVNENESTN